MAVVATTETPFHVLAVDDSLPDRKLIERLLKTSSFQVTTVDSGSKALQFLGIHDDAAAADDDDDSTVSVHAHQLVRVQEKKMTDCTHTHLPVQSSSEPPCSTLTNESRFLMCSFGSASLWSVGNKQDVAVNLIITDYCMPGMTGYDLLKKIKESSSLRDIPVVIMSSENIPSRINRCLEEGADEFFLKPVRLSDMSKLKPHILKSRCREQHYQQEQQHQQSDSNSNDCSNPTNKSSSDNSRKRKAEDNEETLPQKNRPRHS